MMDPMHSDELIFDDLEDPPLPAIDPGITEVPEEDSFVCPGQLAKKTPPPRKKLQDWLQNDAAATAAARVLQVPPGGYNQYNTTTIYKKDL
jgi:hypothetical protein